MISSLAHYSIKHIIWILSVHVIARLRGGLWPILGERRPRVFIPREGGSSSGTLAVSWCVLPSKQFFTHLCKVFYYQQVWVVDFGWLVDIDTVLFLSESIVQADFWRPVLALNDNELDGCWNLPIFGTYYCANLSAHWNLIIVNLETRDKAGIGWKAHLSISASGTSTNSDERSIFCVVASRLYCHFSARFTGPPFSLPCRHMAEDY